MKTSYKYLSSGSLSANAVAPIFFISFLSYYNIKQIEKQLIFVLKKMYFGKFQILNIKIIFKDIYHYIINFVTYGGNFKSASYILKNQFSKNELAFED